MKKALSFIIAGAVVLSACSKKDSKSMQEKVQAKWSIVTIADNDYYSGTSHPSTYTGTATDYVEFKSNGKVYMSTFGLTDSSTYSIINDQSIKIDTDTMQIKSLTDNSFVLYSKDVSGADYYEETITLKK